MSEAKKYKALVLTSGGLDSILAMHILAKQNIEIIGIHMITWFNIPRYTLLEDQPDFYISNGFKVYNIDVSEDYTPILLNPSYGYGTSVNPCIDCKILFFSKAKELLGKYDADFIATGEVIGQRPMTQNPQAMRLIERKSGLEGLLLRPLSAKLLTPTIPEKKGWVDREKLYDIAGRGRKRQIEMAKKFGITDYPSPAGGCILTEKSFAPRFYDLIKHTNNVSINDFLVLRYGRHFRLSKKAKLVIGKNFEENEFLKRLEWGNLKIDLTDIPGPYCLFEWDGRIKSFKLALKICAVYSGYKKIDRDRIKILIKNDAGKEKIIFVKLSAMLDKSMNLSKYMIK